MNDQTIHEGKTIAIISYITWIGTLIAFIMNNDKRNAFAAFHIRQMIGLSVFSLANTFIVARYGGAWASGIIGVGLFVLWMIGFVGAIQGEEKRIPLVGDLFQDWFRNIA
ncbi:MAG: hypothetical protein HKP59_05460 [Lutibacter sp.]|uniref:DUF4870 domain-containing protein n=1 Tax=Lutibacter sp. TaxID=1925666 RepID=UPI00183FBB92|nr:hypothetical protein [Lutibacter sp.]MBT8317052.1 hypothetical protein [Lutibacter sp.]NNJ57912.1 hypothetical protein [Lutibacter sp.]